MLACPRPEIVRCSPEELSEHNQDREGICDDLAGSFNIRYLTAFSDPIEKSTTSAGHEQVAGV